MSERRLSVALSALMCCRDLTIHALVHAIDHVFSFRSGLDADLIAELIFSASSAVAGL
jgi:hypothetical protein